MKELLERIPVEAAVVFGSRARNDHWENSDIDLLVVSSAFAEWPASRRTDFLLDPWPGIPALEPFGVTPEELKKAGTLLLWDALDQGRPLRDDGTFAQCQELFQGRLTRGELQRTRGGWKQLNV